MILNEVEFKGSCPVELFNDLYELSQAGILNINNYEFKRDHALATFFDGMMMNEEVVELNEYQIWFRMSVDNEKRQLFILIGPGGGETRTTIKLTPDVLNFYNKWYKFKQENPRYEQDKVIPVTKNNSSSSKFLQDIECEVCSFTNNCDRVFCLK